MERDSIGPRLEYNYRVYNHALMRLRVLHMLSNITKL
jgi:hypothetical protein